MSIALKPRRTYVWMDSLGDWTWPGTAAPAVEIMPPAWVPALPPQPPSAAPASWEAPRRLRRRLALGGVLTAVAASSATVALGGPERVERLLGYRGAGDRPVAFAARPAIPVPARISSVRSVDLDGAGSSVAGINYHSAALSETGTFYVYLPPGYAAAARRYPVIYLLHGNSQPASAFLEVGLQGTLDSLIARHAIPPVIAVMIQGGPGANNWRNEGTHRYESYVLEVQELVDRLLPTVAARDARAIAGDSMGGYGALHISLGNPYRFGVAESWLGFFNGLGWQVRHDRPVLSRLGMHVFLYGAEGDKIADPLENAPFAASLRAAGADAHSAVYPGEHSLQTIEAHLASVLEFAGRALLHPAVRPAR
jgi:enterochelin esterase-like enzyme